MPRSQGISRESHAVPQAYPALGPQLRMCILPLISGKQLLVLPQPQLLCPVNPGQDFQSGTVLLRRVKNFSHAEVNVSGRKQG